MADQNRKTHIVHDQAYSPEQMAVAMCQGKIIYETRKDVLACIRDKTNGNRSKFKAVRKGSEMQAYQCDICGKYHMGTKHKNKRRVPRSRRIW